MPTIHPTVVTRLARVTASLALVTMAATTVRAQPPTTGTTRAARDSARATAQDTTKRGPRRQSAGGEVDRSPGAPAAGERVRKDQGAPAAPAAPAATPASATPTPATPNPTAPARATPDSAAPRATVPNAAMPAAPGVPAAAVSPEREAATSALVASLQSDAHALALLHESNLAEIQAGTLAQRQARDSAVRAFAAMMVSDHGALDERATALARQAGVTPALPDSQLPRLVAGEMAALPAPAAATPDTAAGAAFDAAYVAQQVAAHARTLALVDAAIERAQGAELRAALQTEVRPRVAAHLDAARQLRQRLGGR